MLGWKEKWLSQSFLNKSIADGMNETRGTQYFRINTIRKSNFSRNRLFRSHLTLFDESKFTKWAFCINIQNLRCFKSLSKNLCHISLVTKSVKSYLYAAAIVCFVFHFVSSFDVSLFFLFVRCQVSKSEKNKSILFVHMSILSFVFLTNNTDPKN